MTGSIKYESTLVKVTRHTRDAATSRPRDGIPQWGRGGKPGGEDPQVPNNNGRINAEGPEWGVCGDDRGGWSKTLIAVDRSPHS